MTTKEDVESAFRADLQAMMQVEELKAKVAELTRALQALQRRSHLIEQFLLFRLLDEGLTGTRLRAAKLADDRFLKYLPLVIQEDKGDIIAVRLKGSELPQSKEMHKARGDALLKVTRTEDGKTRVEIIDD